MADPINKEQGSYERGVNSQVIDTIKQVNTFLKNSDYSLDSISNQLATQSAATAMINIVNQQQQLYTLQNTVTTVAAKAMLESSPQEAVQMMNEVVKDNNLANSLKELKELMNELNNSQ